MDYFDDIDYPHRGEDSHSRARFEREFNGYYGIQYTHTGVIRLRVGDGEWQEMAGPNYFLSAPGAHYTYETPPGGERHHLYLCFTGSRVERWRDGGLLPPPGVLCKAPPDEAVLNTLRRALVLLSAPDATARARCTLLLENLLLDLCRQDNEPTCSALRREKILALADAIRREPVLDWDFAREAAEMEWSYSRFRTVFRQLLGCAPGRYVLECRLNRAAELLFSGDTPIREIARLCGFPNEFHFSAMFRKHRGMPPRKFRS